ncbi:MAG: peptide-methionine (S)-S-oxide reductase MsrA [Exiguobacterium sp.]|uniref:peptide-methionine (S)-S-oxide reductase MsrA n=1 Tax=Exiguobacterium TaxID=33986 RepID=UPI0011CA8659|nr:MULTISPECIES: peptide-methionine (S)-S-oxide reductase MsrA [Exiguobacterium]MBR2680905.1 peptide-methionine (S)-S-oxide reductase MsrA [Exiguobacterium sp.]MCC9624911.1 peptide-methionine (S)-S-oxide reductase MsrA [Thalassospira sp. MA62]QPI69000.1 peptide-methionine (S)-S-oxide reductase MsrA [Exiguobacterium sp. PBE]MBG0917112.1 peptide-methionine (S)-S-oxide reductase MsrA [Exiguobacterium sp. SRB7LM]MBR3061355.1 peptide-methionine (S)-S-oxide reductase MsrA [Exiguobacterium sp.]
MEKATFAGGCFWCMVTPFEELPGIEGIVSGYMGGQVDNPTYEQVKTGTTGHLEVVQITYDPALFSYERLLELYWIQTDPTDDGGQFQDRGPQYAPAIFYHTEEQRVAAEASRDVLAASGRFTAPIVTKIIPATTFFAAEDYHQDYHKKNPKHYKEDRAISGRDEFIEENWTETV